MVASHWEPITFAKHGNNADLEGFWWFLDGDGISLFCLELMFYDGFSVIAC